GILTQRECEPASHFNVWESCRSSSGIAQPLEHFLTPDREGVFIPYLHMDHGGTYSCIRKTPLETFVSNQSLSVLVEAPSIELSGNVRKVTVGSSLNLECLTQGIPAPSIQWKKGDHKSQSGSYSCYAVNEYGSKTESLSIEVYNKTRVSLDKETLISETSDHVILDCPVTIDSRLNITSIAWYKEKNMAEPISFEKELVFRNATQKDQGTYICRVSTPVDAVNQTLRLTVLSEGPSFLSTEEDVRTLEGSNVTVACQANGLPIPKVSWSRKGLPLTSEDGHISISPLGDLSIYFVSLNDQGNYTCSASNIYGSISTHSTIEVIQRSKMATDFKKVKNVIRNVRENVVLECDVVYDSRLDEEVELLWKKDDVPIRINRSKYIAAEKSLKIYNLDISDEGTYECLIKTPFESISSKTALIVSGEPPKIVSEFKKVMLYEGEDLRLECLVRGVPRPSLVWHFQDAPLTNAYVHEIATASKVFRESRVIVKNITKEHDGVYQCRADNDYGTGVAKFSRVNVLSRTKATISESGEISVHAGSNLKIPCAITTDQLNQITNIQWVKPFKVGAKDRVDFGIDGSLSIQDVQKRHSGEYRCLVTTILDNANVTVNVTVNVNAPFISSFPEEEIFIFQGESLALFCRANGIPKPTISWNFNQTSTKAQEEFKILNAISSDSGVYECLARNQYGETRRKSLLRVVQLPFLEEEISVDEGATAELHCIPPRPHVNIHWVGPKSALNGSQLMHDPDTGVFSLESVDLNSVGEYSCVISLENGRSRTLNRHLRIKPEIIMSRNNTHVEVLEGKNLTLECNVLPGIGAKRLWKHNENIIIPGGNREVSNR
ncbi:Hemicentin1like, partial [Caligus rogercresseyi]